MRRWELPTARTEWDLSSSDIRSWEETNNFGRFRREVEDGWLKQKDQHSCGSFHRGRDWLKMQPQRVRRQKVKLFDDV